MKKPYLIRLFALSILMGAFQLSTTQINAQPVEITMTIDFSIWDRGDDSTWYDAITFTEASNPGNPKPGRLFKTNVKRNQRLTWIPNETNNAANNAEIILINVSRNPYDGGAFILNELWYDAKYSNQHQKYIVEGRTKKTGFPQEGAEERYIISFTVRYDDGTYDIYTVDPIIRGSDN